MVERRENEERKGFNSLTVTILSILFSSRWTQQESLTEKVASGYSLLNICLCNTNAKASGKFF